MDRCVSLDVMTTYLQDQIERKIYNKPPRETNVIRVWRPIKVNDLKEATMAWHIKSEVIKEIRGK